MPRTQEERRDDFDQRYINGFLHRRSHRLPAMIEAVRQRWAGEAEFEVVVAKRARLRRVA